MAIVLSSEGERIMLEALISQGLSLHLYVNDYEPGADSTRNDFQEAAGFGYAAISLDRTVWSITGKHPTLAETDLQTFTLEGPMGKVYGYFISRQSGGEYLYGERFSGDPRNIQDRGDEIRLVARLSQNGEQ